MESTDQLQMNFHDQKDWAEKMDYERRTMAKINMSCKTARGEPGFLKTLVKKKKGGDNDYQDWSGENEDVNTLAAKPGSAKRQRHSTRSKDPKKQRVNIPGHKKLVNKGFNG
ncbi:hypothetical protein IEQ34_019025 [Dendrobium chrysotoxum]|uniref:Uncharacterized protein n=1 Tax=Dendrobium chrysotoxum TaxID=161865 RepID=A0AAV7G5P4_DENCH|nr:hypothetical protein IEQ34_019025 [Dendrobium chrysotoxum]